MWGSRVIIPPQGRTAVLQELHEGNPGMTRMKALARMYVWWPLLDKDIKTYVQQCHLCQQQQAALPVTLLQPWKWPSRPQVRLHMDFADPFEGMMILVVIDLHSKWIEAFPIVSSMLSKVIKFSRSLFAQFGIPEVLITDDGPFLSKNGNKHLTCVHALRCPINNSHYVPNPVERDTKTFSPSKNWEITILFQIEQIRS